MGGDPGGATDPTALLFGPQETLDRIEQLGYLFERAAGGDGGASVPQPGEGPRGGV